MSGTRHRRGAITIRLRGAGSSRRSARITVLLTVLCVLSFPAASSAAGLDIVVNGPGTIVATIGDPSGPESSRVVCTTAENPEPFNVEKCAANYVPGTVVTLTAQAIRIDSGLYPLGRSAFGVWSDDRCPPTPVCELLIDDDRQSITASFTPQKVTVYMSDAPEGPGRLTSAPPGFTCEALLNAQRQCVAVFPLFATVQLIAEGAGARWISGCDTVVGTTCTVVADRWRVAQLRFLGGKLGGLGGGVEVRFRVAKEGPGSGTVHGDRINCGASCSEIVEFGQRDTLQAVPDSGSRFLKWRGACGESPRCSLAVGPVTRVTAVFEREPEGRSKSPPASSSPAPSSGTTPVSNVSFVATVDRRVVVRSTRSRRVLFTVRVSARSSIRGVLESARGDSVTASTWQISRGKHALKLPIPRRVPRGNYVLRITARDGRGNSRQFDRRIRVPR